jgi:hypothetical protein
MDRDDDQKFCLGRKCNVLQAVRFENPVLRKACCALKCDAGMGREGSKSSGLPEIDKQVAKRTRTPGAD